MESVFGFVGNGFSVVVSDAVVGRSILVYKQDQDKVVELDDHKVMGLAGVIADGVNFSEYVQKNIKLYELDNDIKLSTHAAANFIRRELATALRKGPFQTNVLIGGYDEEGGASLYFCDYLGTLHKLPFAAHGYSGNFLYSLFDRLWEENMSEEQAIGLVRSCIHQIHTRFLVHQENFVVKIVDKDGVRVIDL